MAVIVFTCTLGDTDPLRPARHTPGVKYLCFSDKPVNVPPYTYIPYDCGDLGPQLASRKLKILADHPELHGSDVTLWHDAAYQLHCDPQTLATSSLRTCDVVAMRHPHRNRIEDEGAAIVTLGYMPADTVAAQIAHYKGQGFSQSAITSTGFCIRRRTPAVEAWQALWWDEVARWGYRDQMSVDYALWKSEVRIHYIPGHYRDNPHARWFNTDAIRKWQGRFGTYARPGALPPYPVRRPMPRRSRYG